MTKKINRIWRLLRKNASQTLTIKEEQELDFYCAEASKHDKQSYTTIQSAALKPKKHPEHPFRRKIISDFKIKFHK